MRPSGPAGVVTLATDELKLAVVPDRGARMISLRHRRSDREWLLTAADEPVAPPAYGDRFVAANVGGWDEMVPTIDPCVVTRKGGDGGEALIYLPDHGELWATPWSVVCADDWHVVTEVGGRALPYRLRRSLELTGPRTVRIGYRLSVTGEDAVPVLWAAHPQFTVRPGTRILLPPEITTVLDVLGGPEPTARPWPAHGLDLVAEQPPGTSRKLYVGPNGRPQWAALVDPDGPWIRLRWDPTKVPYLGLWLDAGHYAGQPVVALEPATAFYDALSRAIGLGRCLWVRPGTPVLWELILDLGFDCGGP